MSGVTSSTTNGTYGAGTVIDVRVTFSEAVYVAGAPRILMETGDTDDYATYASGSGSDTLVFNYTVQSGDTAQDLDCTVKHDVELNGGTIKDAADHDATLTLPTPGGTGSLGANSDIVISTGTLPAYRLPDDELDDDANFVRLSWSSSGTTIGTRTRPTEGGVLFPVTLPTAGANIAIADDWWPDEGHGPDIGFTNDQGLVHKTSVAGYSCYEMVVTYKDGPSGSTIKASLFLNTGLTGPSGYPNGTGSGDTTNDTWWDDGWTTTPVDVGETKTLRLYFNNAYSDHITDNKVPHTGGGLSWTNGWYAINDRDRHEISNIGIQIQHVSGDTGLFQVVLNGPSPTAAQVEVKGARVEDGRVVVEWDTASEVGTAGFYVVRRDGAGGKAKRVGAGLLPGLLHRPEGGTYRLVDPDVREGQTYTYEIVEVETKGSERSCGTCQVTVEEPAGGRVGAAKPRQEPDGLAYSKAPRHRSAPGVEGTIRSNRAAPGNAVGHARPRAAGHAVKIAVKEDGLYYVAATDLAPLLAGSARSVGRLIELAHLSLTCRSESVAYLPAQGGVGLYFYGQAIGSIYTDENVYWLEFGLGDLMAEMGESGVESVAAPQTFTQAVHAEEDRYPATGLFRDPEGDFWLWDYVVSGTGGDSRKSFTVRSDGAALAGRATLSIHLKGATSTKARPDHHARVFLNGVAVGEAWWDDLDAHSLTLPVAAALLLPGANTVTVEGVLDTGAPYSIFYVDSFDLVYERRYQAIGDFLLCRTGDHDVVTISGFTQQQILVLDVTTPRKPRLVVGATIDEVEGVCQVSFASPWPDSACLAVTPQAAKCPLSLTADEASQLKHRGNRADYLMIAPAELKEAAQALADYRAGQGLAAMVVTLEDIYDEFNYGIADPHAIQAFLACACESWRRGPKYVVLAGRGTYDYKNYLGYGDNLVPPLLKSTGYGLFVADRQFAPQLAIGRLPATSASELGGIVQKTIAYERSSGSWTKQVVMTADNADGGGDFPRDSDELARLIPADYAVSKVYLWKTPPSEARRQLLQAFGNGALLVNYIGHGGMDRLAQEGLLTLGDVGSLGNSGRLPVVTTLTCVAGRFDVPGYECLGEALVLQPSGGAIAFLGPSGLLFNGQSKALGQGLLRATLKPGERVLGEVAMEAFRETTGNGSSAGSLELYNLLGDPALKLRTADAATGSSLRNANPRVTPAERR